MAFRSGQAGDTGSIIVDDVFRSGMIAMTGAAAAPSGFLLCDGAEYDPLTYPGLFIAIGTTFNTGGETPGFFRVPAFNARAPVGVGTIGGLVWALGQQKGNENLQQHNHSVTDPGHNHTQNSHTHVQDTHTHTQDAHTHVQDTHTHIQNSHTHVQDPHGHVQNTGTTPAASFNGVLVGTALGSSGFNTGINNTTATNQSSTPTNQNTVATNQNTVATNQSTVATNQSTTATNISNTTGVTVDNAGTGTAQNIQPSLCVNFIIKT